MKKIIRKALEVFIFSILFLLFMIAAGAQENKTAIAGVYFLSGVMETASVFELKKDSSFEFFFSQGALDRGGSGTWRVEDGHLVMNSTSVRPPKDYAMVTGKTIPGDVTVVKMVDKNTMILSYSNVTLTTAAGKTTEETNSQGEARFTKKHGTEIDLLFRLCPDRSSVFTIDPKHNYFEFRLEPWIAEVFFNNFTLALHDGKLSGSHPLLEGKDFSYIKEQQDK